MEMKGVYLIVQRSSSEVDLVLTRMMCPFGAPVCNLNKCMLLKFILLLSYFADVNECAVNNGNCSHICVNDIPYYHCDCPSGGLLDPTNRTCVFNANCSVDNEMFTCDCLPGYQDVRFDGRNCSGKSLF